MQLANGVVNVINAVPPVGVVQWVYLRPGTALVQRKVLV